jgi:hypothetical protein
MDMRIDYFDAIRPVLAFVWQDGQRPEPSFLDQDAGAVLKGGINAGLREKGLDAADIVGLQFMDQFETVLCRVWYRKSST